LDAGWAAVTLALTRIRTLLIVEKLVENRRICLEFSGFLRTFAVRKKGGASLSRC
jgi:hypothetical protein